MQVHPTVASVVGQTSETKWGQVLQSPHAYAVLEVHDPDGRARNHGVEILSTLTSALANPPQSLADLKVFLDEVASVYITTLIILVPVGTMLYIVSRGKGAVYLKRGNDLAVLLDGDGSLAGLVQDADTIIVASAAFTTTLTHNDILGVFDHGKPTEVAEKLTLLLHEKNQSDGGSALIFHMEVAERVAEQEVAVPAPKASPPAARMRQGGVEIVRKIARLVKPKQRAMIKNFVRNMRDRVRLLPPKTRIALLLVFLFGITTLFGVMRRVTSAAHDKNANTIAQAQHSYDEGMALADLNPIKSRERLNEAVVLLAPLASQKATSSQIKEAKDLYDLAQKNLTGAMRISEVVPELFFDVALVKSGARASEMSLFEDKLGILDRSSRTVFSVDVGTKKGAVVAGGESLSGATHLASYADVTYIMTPKGIAVANHATEKVKPSVIPYDQEWGSVTVMTAYGGNLYLLDTNKHRIWKYVGTDAGFSERREYLNPDVFPDLSRAISLVIDGSVWLGTTNGQIMRFSAGKESTYHPSGLDRQFGDTLRVYTADDVTDIYVLDSKNNRVVVLDKEGVYLAQYYWGQGFLPEQIVVSEKKKKILLLSAGKIYAIGLEL